MAEADQSSTSKQRKSSAPSLFSNQHSRGPLYQYWRERSRESAEVRERRISDARERASGRQPVRPESGPSSNAEFQSRLDRGKVAAPTPAYSERPVAAKNNEELPGYTDMALYNSNDSSERGEFARSAEEERDRLRKHLDGQHDRTGFQSEDVTPNTPEISGMGKERKKSIGKSIGNWMGVAFTGYGMKSDGKGNTNRF